MLMGHLGADSGDGGWGWEQGQRAAALPKPSGVIFVAHFLVYATASCQVGRITPFH